MGPTAKRIVSTVAERHSLSVNDLIGPSRLAWIVQARQEAVWELRQVVTETGKPKFSLSHIGSMFGRDHTTVFHACKRHEQRP